MHSIPLTRMCVPLAVRRHHLPLLPPEEAVRRGGLPPLQQAQHNGRVHRQDRLLPLPLRHWPLLPRLPAHPLRPDPRGGCSSSVRHTSRRWQPSRRWQRSRRFSQLRMFTHGPHARSQGHARQFTDVRTRPRPAHTDPARCLLPAIFCPAGGARADGRGLLAVPPLLRGGAPRGGLDVQQQHLHEEARLQTHRWAFWVHQATQATQRM